MRESVIVYGSLLNKDELDETFESYRTSRIKIEGFGRYMNQRSDVRKPESGTVITVQYEENSWVNGVLVYEISGGFNDYIERESGYELVNIESNKMSTYDDTEIPVETALIPIGNLIVDEDSRYSPISEYVAECVDGAMDWGSDFLTDFVATTDDWP